MNRSYSEFIARQTQKYAGTEHPFDVSGLDGRFVKYFESGDRIKIDFSGLDENNKLVYGHYIKTGTVGVTTGWKPAFLLMRTSRSIGSVLILGPDERIVAVQSSRGKYVLEGV